MKIDGALIGSDWTRAGEQAALLEAQGFAGAWSFEGQHDPFVPLVLAAERTETIELGTAIAVAFARNPMTTAYLAQDLQTLAKGRFILGLGTQIRPHIEKRFSQPWSKPVERMREFVGALRAIFRAWADGSRLDFRGEFYTHTLMTPMFSPPLPFGSPPVFLAGFGPRMVEMVGEVADGFLVHPFHSRPFLEAETLPALSRGLGRAGREPDARGGREPDARGAFTISCQTIVALGSNDAEIERARHKARGQISFYGSTPAYKGVLEHHGREELQPELNRLSKQGKWLDMIGLIDDALFDQIAVSGTPAEVAAKLRARNGFADRTTLMLYNETLPEAVVDVVRELAG
jgi:probable F420-dependent oxidoreductase